jgi:protein-S-isoprenylcysteine O-methyltransferase Ste14
VTRVDSPRRRVDLGWLLSTTALISVTMLFALAHWQHWRRTGSATGVFFAAQEVAIVGVALVRRRPFAVSRRAHDWFSALVGGYVVLLLRPGGHAPAALAQLGTVLQVIGAAAAAACVFQLGRSFGVVAANRGIKCRGPYGVVRHPIYAAYVVATTGYLCSAPTWWNAGIVAVAIAAQCRRIAAEEAVLSKSPEYRAYTQQVPWRLIPRVI